MLKLGTNVTDTATGLPGQLVMMQADTAPGIRFYRFQPRGLDAETGAPVEPIWLEPARIKGGKEVPEPDLPLNVLGTVVTDDASGFTGVATSLQLHISGCVHVFVQPKGKDKNKRPIGQCQFDIRRLSGKAIKPMTEKARQASERERPSPIASTHHHPA